MSESVQWAVLTPLVLLCLVGLIQGGVWWNGRTCAQQAAAAGADTAAFAGAEAARGAAASVASRGSLSDVSVSVTDTGGAWEVTVTGRAEVFLDLGQGQVRGRAIAAKETR